MCSIGTLLTDSCDNHSYGKSVIKCVSDYSSGDIALLKRRVKCEGVITLCTYHHKRFVDKYHHLFGGSCCDPFSSHTKAIKKQLREISLELSDTYPSLLLTPGKSICCTCLKRLSCTGSEEHEDCEEDVLFSSPEVVIESVNEAASSLGVSPIKIRKLSDEKKHLEVEKVVTKFSKAVEQTLLGSFDVPNFKKSDEAVSPESDDMVYLIESIKQRLKTCSSNSERIKVISVTPKSWTIEKTAKEFGVSSYLVRKMRDLVKEFGIIPEINLKKPGKTLSQETVDLVTQFYQNDDVSRSCPGMKDTVSVRLDGKKQLKQKRLILCNLKELYVNFKESHPNVTVGFSKFCTLRPKWCILAGPHGTHSVCVCLTHQNVKLMTSAAKLGSCTDLIKKTVCDIENESCMFGECTNCPPVDVLRSEFNPDNSEETITYHQWVTTDRCDLVTVVATYEEFEESLLSKVNTLKSHHYEAKMQSKYFKTKKETLQTDECVVVGDFAENYSFIIQDEVQSYHWVNSQATLHPFCIYYKDGDGHTCCQCVCFISDCLNHNTATVYAFQKKLIPIIKSDINPSIKKVIYFSDGAAQQYKNRKNFLNLCKHQEDFGLQAEWHFFAASHGKGPCDGVGGTVKRLVAKASLQRTTTNHIMTPETMYQFCKENIKGIQFVFVSTEEVEETVRNLNSRFSEALQVPQTRRHHCFIPQDQSNLKISRVSSSFEQCNFVFKVTSATNIHSSGHVKLLDYIACVYGDQWFIGKVVEVSEEHDDVKVVFFHPSGPSTTFKLEEKDVVWVEKKNILDILTPIEFSTATGRVYNISQEKNTYLSMKMNNHFKK